MQIVRDMAALELPAAHWADVDAAVATIADALVRDDPEELQDALADLETGSSILSGAQRLGH